MDDRPSPLRPDAQAGDTAVVARPPRLAPWHFWLWPLLLVALALGMWLLPWGAWIPGLRGWVEGHGAVGILAFLVVYVAVVILPLPAAAMSVVGGLAFGWWGFPLSMAGSVLGAIPPYLIGRIWLRDALLRRVSGRKLMAADRAIGRNGFAFVALLRLTPVLPFTAQNWLLGLTAVRLRTYVVATIIGLAPGTLAMVWIGEMGGLASVGSNRAQLWIAGTGLVAFGALVVWLGRIATIEMRKAGFTTRTRPRGSDSHGAATLEPSRPARIGPPRTVPGQAMTEDSDVTTDRDDHKARHQAMLMGQVWLAVYPVVTAFSYLTANLEVPTFVTTFLTTALTVPLITFVVVPSAKILISKADPKA